METGGPRVTSKRAAGPSEAADRRSPLHGRVQLGPPPCPEWVVVVSSCWGVFFLFLCVQSKKETLLSIKSSRNRAKELDREPPKSPAQVKPLASTLEVKEGPATGSRRRLPGRWLGLGCWLGQWMLCLERAGVTLRGADLLPAATRRTASFRPRLLSPSCKRSAAAQPASQPAPIQGKGRDREVE